MAVRAARGSTRTRRPRDEPTRDPFQAPLRPTAPIVSGPRSSGSGRRFELVLMRLRPPVPRTVGLVAKHAATDSYHWVLVAGRSHADPGSLARLLAVAYLDEASGLLGRGDPRWSIPRAYLRRSGALETVEDPRGEGAGLPDFVRRELDRISAWLRERHRPYLTDLGEALRHGAPDERFRRLTPAAAERRDFLDPTGRGLLAPDPPPVVTRTRAPTGTSDATRRLPWRRFRAHRG